MWDLLIWVHHKIISKSWKQGVTFLYISFTIECSTFCVKFFLEASTENDWYWCCTVHHFPLTASPEQVLLWLLMCFLAYSFLESIKNNNLIISWIQCYQRQKGPGLLSQISHVVDHNDWITFCQSNEHLEDLFDSG